MSLANFERLFDRIIPAFLVVLSLSVAFATVMAAAA